MHSWLAKPLDWLAIQAACRSAACHPPPRLEPLELPVALAPPLGAEGPDMARVDLQLAVDGTFQFQSLVPTPADRNNIVHGRLFRVSTPWEQYPTVILLHGWNAELCYRYLFPHLAARLAQNGINTMMFELPYHMHRRPRSGPVRDFISTDLNGMLQATRQAIADTQVLCRWLARRGVHQVGLWGFSLGAWLTGLLARFEPDLSFAVLTTPIARIDRAIAELAFCEPIRRSLQGRTVDLGELNLAAVRPRLDPARLLLVASRYDLFAPGVSLEELWLAWGRPELWRPKQGHISVLASGVTRRRTVDWIAERLRSPALSGARS